MDMFDLGEVGEPVGVVPLCIRQTTDADTPSLIVYARRVVGPQTDTTLSTSASQR